MLSFFFSQTLFITTLLFPAPFNYQISYFDARYSGNTVQCAASAVWAKELKSDRERERRGLAKATQLARRRNSKNSNNNYNYNFSLKCNNNNNDTVKRNWFEDALCRCWLRRWRFLFCFIFCSLVAWRASETAILQTFPLMNFVLNAVVGEAERREERERSGDY